MGLVLNACDIKNLYIKNAREKQIPFFGICYGFQMAIVEYARNVVGLKDVYSAEIKPQAKTKIVEIYGRAKKANEPRRNNAIGRNRSKVCQG